MDVFELVIRARDEVTKTVAVQAYDEEDARQLTERLFTNSEETIMTCREVPHPPGETFVEFMADRQNIDYLFCTGGKKPSVVTQDDERVRKERREQRRRAARRGV